MFPPALLGLVIAAPALIAIADVPSMTSRRHAAPPSPVVAPLDSIAPDAGARESLR
jgi:hypothetical protein